MKPSATPALTQKDLAQAMGMSQSTVSMALRGHPSIPEETRNRIRKAAEKLGYRPNPMGTVLAHLKHATREHPVGAALAWLNAWPEPEKLHGQGEFGQYWQGASVAAAGLGYHLEEFILNEHSSMVWLGRILRTRNIAGIVIPPGPLPRGWRDFDWDGFSVVRLQHSTSNDDLRAISVTSNQVSNAILACETMIGKGYRRIGFVGFRSRDRINGAGCIWAQRMQGGTGQLEPLLLSHGCHHDDHLSWQTSQQQFERWFNSERPDAILTEVPELARFIGKAGLRVPDDVAVATLGTLDSTFDAGIDQNPREIGKAGVMTLHYLITTGVKGIPSAAWETLIPGSWVNGTSLPDRVAMDHRMVD